MALSVIAATVVSVAGSATAPAQDYTIIPAEPAVVETPTPAPEGKVEGGEPAN